MSRLRAPGGCPWDREQTFDTIKKYTLEEAYEVLEAIDNRDWPELTGELGDLLLQVLFYSEMANEQGLFSIDDVLDTLSNKLIGRHPHVFGDVKAEDAHQVLRNWEALKKEEKRRARKAAGAAADQTLATNHDQAVGKLEAEAAGDHQETHLGGVSSKMPALMEAGKISSKAAHVGFDWPEIEGLFDKLAEETTELKEHVNQIPPGALQPEGRSKIPLELRAKLEDEVGDLFFVLVNIARYLAVDPESALRRTNRKFRRRFGWLEKQLRSQGKTLEEATLDEMETLWQQAKTHEEEHQP